MALSNLNCNLLKVSNAEAPADDTWAVMLRVSKALSRIRIQSLSHYPSLPAVFLSFGAFLLALSLHRPDQGVCQHSVIFSRLERLGSPSSGKIA